MKYCWHLARQRSRASSGVFSSLFLSLVLAQGALAQDKPVEQPPAPSVLRPYNRLPLLLQVERKRKRIRPGCQDCSTASCSERTEWCSGREDAKAARFHRKEIGRSGIRHQVVARATNRRFQERSEYGSC